MSPETIAILKAPLDPKHVKKPSGSFGPKGDYLEGWHVINELNRAFGFDGWSYQIELTKDSLEHVEVEKTDYKTKATFKEMQWQAAYTCVCTLTVGHTVRQDVGFGSGFAKGVGDAIEGATKEAATDALKRAARTFGNIFGLALYDKERANVSAPPAEAPALIADDEVTKIEILLEGNRVPVAELLKAAKVARVTDITAERVPSVMRWIERRIAPPQAKEAT